MEDTTIRPVNYDYDETVQEFLQLVKKEKATYGIDAKIAGEDYFKTNFSVPANPVEIRKFSPPDVMIANAAGAIKDKEIANLIDHLKEDDYFLIHFPLIIDTKFPFDHIELAVELVDEKPNYFFVNTFPEPKDKTLLDGKLEGSVNANAEGSLSLKTPEELKKMREALTAGQTETIG